METKFKNKETTLTALNVINKTAIEGSTNIPGQSQSIKSTYKILIQLNLWSLGGHLSGQTKGGPLLR